MLYTVVAVVCTQFSLLDHPGYEFSFVIALTATLVAPLLSIALVRPAYRTPAPPGGFAVVRHFKRAAALNLLLLCIPLGIILLNGLFVPLCDAAEGVAFYLLLPVVTAIVSVALALFCVVHYRKSRTMVLVFILLSFGAVLFLGYTTPRIDSYNLFYGYFPGLTYDELLPISTSLVLFRLLTLGIAAVLLWWTVLLAAHTLPSDGVVRKGTVLLRVLWNHHRIPSVVILAAALLLYIFRCDLGWESTAGSIQSALGSVVETEHCTIWYDSSAVRGAEVRRMAAEHEFRVRQVLEAFALPRVPRIVSYVYPSAALKRRLIGAGDTEIAKPWSSEIHVTQQGVDAVLKHELVHVVAAPFGLPVIRASLSTGLVEGLAVAVDGTWGYRTLPQYAAALHRSGLAPDIRDLMSITGFAAQSSSVSYLLAGAFTRFLIDRYGMRAVTQVYRHGDYDSAFGTPLASLIAAWRASLDSVGVGEQEMAAVDVFFRRPSIFRRICPRDHARRMAQARSDLAARRYADARDRFEQVYRGYGGYDALAGYLLSSLRSGRAAHVVRVYDSLMVHDPLPRRYLPLAVTVGDAAWALGDERAAAGLFTLVREADVTPSLSEAAALRLWALATGNGAGRFRNFFLADVSDTVRADMVPERTGGAADTLALFLRGRVLFRLGRFWESAELMQQAGPVRRDPLLESRRCVTVGDALMRTGALQAARAWYWMSLNADARPAARLDIEDRIARCEFLEVYR